MDKSEISAASQSDTRLLYFPSAICGCIYLYVIHYEEKESSREHVCYALKPGMLLSSRDERGTERNRTFRKEQDGGGRGRDSLQPHSASPLLAPKWTAGETRPKSCRASLLPSRAAAAAGRGTTSLRREEGGRAEDGNMRQSTLNAP